jgi:hypothetical protein
MAYNRDEPRGEDVDDADQEVDEIVRDSPSFS